LCETDEVETEKGGEERSVWESFGKEGHQCEKIILGFRIN
jgi:hypothetical protein